MAKLSEWLKPGQRRCGTCNGTGSAGTNAKGETIPCPSCGGFGSAR
jgi:DnaJ-class molecular chaperone